MLTSNQAAGNTILGYEQWFAIKIYKSPQYTVESIPADQDTPVQIAALSRESVLGQVCILPSWRLEPCYPILHISESIIQVFLKYSITLSCTFGSMISCRYSVA